MAADKPADQVYQWINQVTEAAIEPDLPICDAHHHLWADTSHTGWPYLIDDLYADTNTGHNVVSTVFLDCRASYRKDGPEHLRPVGEVEFVAEQAALSKKAGKTNIAAIVGRADVSLGDRVEDVLNALEAASDGLFRGIRYGTAQDDHPPLRQPVTPPMTDPELLNGIRRVGALGYSFDAMVYHPQLPALGSVLRACPDTNIVINHLGLILGTGPYKGQREQILAFWRDAIADLAQYPNAYLKLGGIGMPMMGFRWDKQAKPPTSDELAAPWKETIQFAIDQFGADRCLFESNYPIDKRGAGYAVLWNAYKKITSDYSPGDREHLFCGTASSVYRIA